MQRNMQCFSSFTEEIIGKQKEQISPDRLNQLREAANQLYDGTFSKVASSDYLKFLCHALPHEYTTTEIEITRHIYLDHFSWKPSFLECLRMACCRITLKAESQYIEMFLDSLSNHWWHKYKEHSIVRSLDGVFLVFYSLVLLNTDFTTATSRISKKNYIKNTITSLSDNNVFITNTPKLVFILQWYYDDLVFKRLPSGTQTSKRDSIVSLGSRKSSFFKSATESWFSDKASIHSTETSSSFQRRSVGFANALVHGCAYSMQQLKPSPSSLTLTNEKDAHETQHFIEEEGDVDLELQGPPWIKEGIILYAKRDPVNRRSHSLASWWGERKSWKNVFAVASRGELNLYVFNQSKSGSLQNGDGNWLENATCLGSFNLCQCLAKALSKSELETIVPQCGLSTKRNQFQFPWLLTFSDGSSPLVFSSSTEENVSEFVETCNLWGARLCAVPASEILSSSEFGWSSEVTSYLEGGHESTHKGLFNYLNSCSVERWTPINGGLVNTKLPMQEQLEELRSYKNDLSRRLTENDWIYEKLKTTLGTWKLKKSENYLSTKLKLVQTNFSSRQRHLTDEIVRITTYLEILEKALQLRAERVASPSTLT